MSLHFVRLRKVRSRAGLLRPDRGTWRCAPRSGRVLGRSALVALVALLAPTGWARATVPTEPLVEPAGPAAFAPNGRVASSEQAGPVAAAGQHCAGQPGPRLVWHQLLVGRVNPLGVEHSGRFGVCVPWVERPGLLFSRTNVEVGAVHQLSPAYGHLGGYLQVTPLSLLVLRVEMSALWYWPFPADRSGYFRLSSYDDDHEPEVLTYDIAESARGMNVNLIASPRARIEAGPVALLALDVLSYEYWAVGDGAFYVNPRRELVLRRRDRLLANEAMAMVEFPLTDGLDLRLGGYDALAYGIGSGVANNSVGGLAMLHWSAALAPLRQLTPFLRVGAYTHHPFRVGQLALYVGALGTFDVAALP